MSTHTHLYRFLAGLGLALGLAAPCRAALTFSWSMESESPDLYPAGSDTTPTYYPPGVAKRSTDEAHSGSYSLAVGGGAWRAATFDNPTNNTVWAPLDQGAIVLWWKYTGIFGAEMLMQITGKSSVPALDTNDGFALMFHGNNEIRFGDLWYKRYTSPFEEDHWYKITTKWNANGTIHRFLQIDDETPMTSTTPLSSVTCLAWHQVLWGNDRNTATLQGLYLDDVQIWNDFAMTPVPEPGSLALLGMGVAGLLARRQVRRDAR